MQGQHSHLKQNDVNFNSPVLFKTCDLLTYSQTPLFSYGSLFCSRILLLLKKLPYSPLFKQ